MPDSIETWRVQQFRNLIRHDLQEKGGKLRSTVSYDGGYTGKAVSPVNFVGQATARKVTDRRGDTPHMDLSHNRRWVTPTDYEWGHLVDSFDKLRTGLEADGEYKMAGEKAIRRGEDEEILSAFYATAKIGEVGELSEAWVDSGYVVAEGSTGLTHDKLIAARKLFGKYSVELEEEELFLIVTEEEVADLFGISTSISIDYVDGRPVQTGRLPMLYGFTFVPFSSSYIDSLTGFKSGNVRTLPCYVKSGMHLGVWSDLVADVFPMPNKKNMPQIYVCETIGATRLQKGKVLKVKTTHS